MDIKLLRAKMALHGDTQADLAKALDVVPATLSTKMNRQYDFTRSEIDTIVKRYGLTADEIKQIFFS